VRCGRQTLLLLLLGVFLIAIADQGWAVSPPGDFKYMRIETPELSEIPIRLAERGFRLRYIGSGATRNTSAGIIPIDVIEIALGK
jgi:hypothetical protein